jgi:predicted acetyltransferase
VTLDFRDLDKDDLSRSFDLRTRAFGTLPDGLRPQWDIDVSKAIDEHRVVAAYDGDVLVGRAMIWPFTQYWGGRALPMAGIAGVVVSPEHRDRGVGTGLMAATAVRGRELGFPVSVLYPATVPVYRRTGWEVAGAQTRITITARLLRELRGSDVEIREAGPGDAGRMLAIMREQYAAGRVNGPRDYDTQEFAEELDDAHVIGCIADDGFAVYGWEGKDIVVYQLVAGSAATARALWAVVGSSSSVVERIDAYVGPDDPIHQLLGECVVQGLKQTRWMLRLLDVEAALKGRGYPVGLHVEVPLVLKDDLLPGNAVAGRLQVADGSGALIVDTGVADDPDAVRLGANGLAALYAGTSTVSLQASGLVRGGGAEQLARLDSAFVSRPAYLLDYF